MTHMAMSSIRVMATCALLGEAVGRAAAMAAAYGCAPHDIYLQHMDALQKSLLEGDCFLPSKVRSIPNVCKNAALCGAPDAVRNGQDRAHRIYGTEETDIFTAQLNAPISYNFAAAKVESVHIVFSSDLERDTLEGSWVARQRSTRANLPLDYPQLTMPKTLCREFKLLGRKGDKVVELLHVTDNRKRSYHIRVDQTFESLILLPITTWGNEKASLISFDFA